MASTDRSAPRCFRSTTCVVAVALLVGGCVGNPAGERTTPAPASIAPATPMPASAEPTSSPSPSPATTGPVLSLATIQRLDARTGFVAAWTGGGPGLARTMDGGATWVAIPVPTARITYLRFIDVNVGWVGGFIPRDVPGVACQQAPPGPASPCYGAVLRTVDGGATWQKVLLIPDYGTYPDPVLEIQAIDGYRAWALTLSCSPTASPVGPSGCPSILRRTTDGGQTWTTQLEGIITAIRFATALRGWLSVDNLNGTSDIRVTSDGGSSWRTVLRTTSGGVVGLDAVNSQTAWVMTQDGGYCSASSCDKYELMRTLDGGSNWSSLGNPKPASGGCFGGHLVGPLFASTTRGWLAENLGAGGAEAATGLLQTEDGGRSWRCSAAPVNTTLVSAADPLHVWVAATSLADQSTTLFSSDDAGLSWHSLDLSALA